MHNDNHTKWQTIKNKTFHHKHLDYAFAYIENLTIPRLQLPSVRLIIVHVFAPRIYFSRKFILKVTILKDLCMMAPRAFLKVRKEYCIDPVYKRDSLQQRRRKFNEFQPSRVDYVHSIPLSNRGTCSRGYSQLKNEQIFNIWQLKFPLECN